MFAWGSTVNGELGVGGVEEEHVLAPVPLAWPGAGEVVDAACGAVHSLLLCRDGKVHSCGSNDYGQLGHDQPRKRPQQVTGLDAYEIVNVACGLEHSMALSQWGQVFTWGSDQKGQLGHYLKGNVQSTPKIIKALATHFVVQIACGKRHSMALTNNGDLYVWGDNEYGQLGLGTTSKSEPNPAVVMSLAGIPIAFIACGGSHSFVVSKSGAVYGWGKNASGQLGLNDTVSKSYPCQLRSLRNRRVCHVSCGDDFSAFLTMDGGVLTCGAGNYGQLGHGNASSEMLPRQVSELMGSTVTQVSCGRQHTLAFVPSRGRIYSFGLGGAGQLGTKNPGNALTPQIVLGPWVSRSGHSVAGADKLAERIHRIFTGGDHCFAKIVDDFTGGDPYDCRVYLPHSQILELGMNNIQKCLDFKNDSTIDQELITYLETVFKSVACFNGSFLMDNNEHYTCSSRHHGVNFMPVEETFSIIGKLENQSIKEIIWNCITEDLLNQLTKSPPDVEALRIYLILPYYHEFNNPKQHLKLHKPYSTSLLRLEKQASRVVRSWWRSSPSDYFEKLVCIFKSVAAYLIRGQRVAEGQTVQYDQSLASSLNVLAVLKQLNHSFEGLKVPFDTFHITDLTEYIDVRVDYLRWLTDFSDKFYLCNYPFIFDAQAKTLLLETDQSIQMQTAMNAAAQQALMALFMGPSAMHSVNQFLVLNITRDNIVEDALRELSAVDPKELKKPLKIKFHGEEAEDAGGVKKEFFLLLLREILDPKFGMFKEYEETRTIWFSEDSFEEKIMYFLIGQICGLAIYNFIIINIPFPLVLYKKLLKEPAELSDLKGLSPTIANSLQQLLDYEGADITDVFGLNFEITRDAFGEVRVIPLKPDGENIPVTQDNKQEYVNLYVDYILNKSVEVQFNSFYNGFMKVCGGRVLQLFHPHELMAVVVGNENYDWHALEEGAEYKNGYKSSDKVIRWFWEVLHAMTLEDKKKFLLFLTGCDRIPLQGMKAIKIILQPTNDEKFLPVAHTCFNLLDLPRYKTKERLKYKLLQAIQQTQGFSLV